MDKYLLISESGMERSSFCKVCKDCTLHIFNMIAYSALAHKVSYTKFCTHCLGKLKDDEELTCQVLVCTVPAWEEIIDPMIDDFDLTNN